jgi:predicted DCC family thiol-disulfide oxidoreductase YuxK
VANKPVLIFDGDCGGCQRAADWLRRQWRTGSAEAIASQSLSDVDLRAWGLRRRDVDERVWWCAGSDARGGEAAMAAALRHARGPWHWVGRFLGLPPVRLITRPGYNLVARHRHLLPGATSSCRVPSASSEEMGTEG